MPRPPPQLHTPKADVPPSAEPPSRDSLKMILDGKAEQPYPLSWRILSLVEFGDFDIARIRRPQFTSSPTFGYSSIRAARKVCAVIPRRAHSPDGSFGKVGVPPPRCIPPASGIHIDNPDSYSRSLQTVWGASTPTSQQGCRKHRSDPTAAGNPLDNAPQDVAQARIRPTNRATNTKMFAICSK